MVAGVPAAPRAQAQTYDLIIRGGRVIDPSVGLDAIRDVAIMGTSIVAVEPNIAGPATETIDARGKIVTPGLIDIHSHAANKPEFPAAVVREGITGWIDAGSVGMDDIDRAVAVARGAPGIARVLIHVVRGGALSRANARDLNNIDVAGTQGAIARHRDMVVGVKVQISENNAGGNDLETLRRAQEMVGPFGLPIMVHIGQGHSPMRAVMPLLKRGDIVTHLYAPAPNPIYDEQGRIFPEVMAARRRGVIFDFGNGSNGHYEWATTERAMKTGFWPDTISTDFLSVNPSVVDFPNVLSKFLYLGMPLSQVIACGTVNAARVFPCFSDRGTLNVGAPADVALMELRTGRFDFVDNFKAVRTGTQRLFPAGVVVAGKRVT